MYEILLYKKNSIPQPIVYICISINGHENFIECIHTCLQIYKYSHIQ